MNAAAIISTINSTIAIANALIQAGKDAKPAFDALRKFFKSENITEDELKELQKRNDELAAELQEPLPDEEED